uniref:KIB1-4 beta-propeller domain-containing protein n=1 Tax=Chenopodium quinoa TaxID=63459 RepID=A0A803L897_CHEQI
MKKEDRGAKTRVRRKIATRWSDLSPETLLRIGNRLESRLDVSRFRSVCKNWRASLPLPRNPSFLTPFFPRQIPNPISLPFNKQGYDNIDLVPISVFFVKRLDCQLDNDSKGWILTVEERQPGKIRLLYPISRDPISNFPKNLPKTLNLSDFRVSEIGKGCCFRSDSGSISDCKVVVYSDSAQQLYATATDFTAVVLYSLGNLFGLRLNGGFWKFEKINSFLWFKDIICFRGTFYAVAGGGKLYVVDHLTFKVTDTVVDCFVCAPNCAIQLVESCQELLLVVKDDIKVYKLNVVLQKWEAVQTLVDRIMFLGIDCCFLLSTENVLWHKGNFIVSSSSLNSLRSKWVELTENFGIYISCLEDVVKKIHKTNFEAISCMLWPPPTWLPPDTSTPGRDSEKDEHEQVDIRSLASPTRPEIAFPVVKNEVEEQIPVNQSPNFLSSSTFEERIVSDTVHRHEKALEPETPENNALSGSKAPKMQHSWEYASMLKLSGIEVRSDFLPVLEKIWVKHGDVVEGSAIRSCDTKATALESLAKMVIILKSNSGKTLSEDHAHYLEKALALRKRMQLEAVLMEIDKVTVVANAIEHNFLEKIAEVKQVLERDKKIVFDSMSVFGPIEQEQCLGKDLC